MEAEIQAPRMANYPTHRCLLESLTRCCRAQPSPRLNPAGVGLASGSCLTGCGSDVRGPAEMTTPRAGNLRRAAVAGEKTSVMGEVAPLLAESTRLLAK